MLENILRTESYALAMSPGFFQFYALTGVLHAFEDYNCLNPTHISGSSAGALVGGFLASGMKPNRMIDLVLKIKRQDIWDIGGIGGLLKGQLFQKALENDLDIRNIEECLIPFGATAWEIFGFRTKIITSGDIATAIRASCTFPFLFQPVLVDDALCIDGGVFDTCGMMALPGIPSSNLVVNIVCGVQRMKSSKLPEKYSQARLLTIVMKNIPSVSPFSMEDRGPLAYKVARLATHNALRRSHILQLANNHWCCYIDGEGVDPSMQIPRIVSSNIHLDSMSNVVDAIPSPATSKPASPLRKSSSFTFINQGSDSIANSALSIHSTSNQINAVEINPELDMLASLLESDVDPQTNKRDSVKGKPQKTNQQVHSKNLKRKHESAVEEDIETYHESVTNSLLELCKATKLTTIPIPWNKFDDIDEVTRDEAKELCDKILYRNGSMRMIAVVMPSPRENISSNSTDGQLRKSRRKSSSVYAGRDNLVEKWAIGKVIREANVEERRLGFTHVLHVANDSDANQGDFLVNLTLFGYYDIDRHRQLKPDKLGMPQDRWVGLKTSHKS